HGGERAQRAGAGAGDERLLRHAGRRDPARRLALEERRAPAVERARGGHGIGRGLLRRARRGGRLRVAVHLRASQPPLPVLHPEARIRLPGLPALPAAVRRRRRRAGGRGAEDVRRPAHPRHPRPAGQCAPGRHRRGGLCALRAGGERDGAALQPDPARMMPLPIRPLLFALACTLLAACSAGESDSGPARGVAAPSFEAMDLDGSVRRFPEDFAGEPVIIDFWADWCRNCASSMTRLVRAWGEHAASGLSVLAVNVAQERATATAFIERLGVGYSAVLDPESRITRQYGVKGLPMTIFVDRNGLISGKVIGEVDDKLLAI